MALSDTFISCAVHTLKTVSLLSHSMVLAAFFPKLSLLFRFDCAQIIVYLLQSISNFQIIQIPVEPSHPVKVVLHIDAEDISL